MLILSPTGTAFTERTCAELKHLVTKKRVIVQSRNLPPIAHV